MDLGYEVLAGIGWNPVTRYFLKRSNTRCETNMSLVHVQTKSLTPDGGRMTDRPPTTRRPRLCPSSAGQMIISCFESGASSTSCCRRGARRNPKGVMALSPRSFFEHVAQQFQDLLLRWIPLLLKEPLPLRIPVLGTRM